MLSAPKRPIEPAEPDHRVPPSAPRPDPPAPGKAAPSPWLPAGAVLLAVLLAVGIIRRLGHPAPPRRAPVPAPAAPVGSLMVELPPAAAEPAFRATLLRFGEIARSGGRAVDRLTLDELAATPLEPGVYLARFRYQDRPLPDTVIQVTAEGTLVQPPARELAEAEYAAGVAKDLHGSAGVDHFRRAVRLYPEHVKAHLQLAAYELLAGSPRAVRRHLAAVRRIEPQNPDARRVERLLRRRMARTR